MPLEAADREMFYECNASSELITAFEKQGIKVICSESQVLFRQGEPGNSVYLALEGELRLMASVELFWVRRCHNRVSH